MTAGPLFAGSIYKQTWGWEWGSSLLQRIVECAFFVRSWFEGVVEDYKEIGEIHEGFGGGFDL